MINAHSSFGRSNHILPQRKTDFIGSGIYSVKSKLQEAELARKNAKAIQPSLNVLNRANYLGFSPNPEDLTNPQVLDQYLKYNRFNAYGKEITNKSLEQPKIVEPFIYPSDQTEKANKANKAIEFRKNHLREIVNKYNENKENNLMGKEDLLSKKNNSNAIIKKGVFINRINENKLMNQEDLLSKNTKYPYDDFLLKNLSNLKQSLRSLKNQGPYRKQSIYKNEDKNEDKNRLFNNKFLNSLKEAKENKLKTKEDLEKKQSIQVPFQGSSKQQVQIGKKEGSNSSLNLESSEAPTEIIDSILGTEPDLWDFPNIEISKDKIFDLSDYSGVKLNNKGKKLSANSIKNYAKNLDPVNNAERIFKKAALSKKYGEGEKLKKLFTYFYDGAFDDPNFLSQIQIIK